MQSGDVVSFAKFVYRYAQATMREQVYFFTELYHYVVSNILSLGGGNRKNEL